MDIDSFLLEIERDDFLEDTKEDLEEWFDTSNYHKDMVLLRKYAKNDNVNKKVIVMMKNELGKGHMSEFIALSPNVYAYKQVSVDKTLSSDKKARGTSKTVTKRTLSFNHCKKFLFNNEIVKCIQCGRKSTPSSVDTMQINRIALKDSDNKRLRSFDGITIFPYGTNAFKVCAEELKGKHVIILN